MTANHVTGHAQVSDPHQKFKSTIVFVFMVPDEIEGKKMTIIQQFSSSLVSFH